jgi:hypothetical protein
MKNHITFLPDNQIRSLTQKYDNPQKDTLLKGSLCTYDIVTMFYYARTLDYRNDIPGTTYPVSFVIDDDIFDISIRYIGREVKRIPGLGTFRGIKEGPAIYGGTAYTPKGAIAAGGYEGYKVLLDQILTFFKTGVAPISKEETIEIFTFMKASNMSKEQNGKIVTMEEAYRKGMKDAQKLIKTYK